jgi:hypothetical protein
MSAETLGFAVSFLFIAAILLWFVIGSRGKWIVKAICIASLALLSVLNWQSINSMLGWATEDVLPEKFEILWVVIKEPSKTQLKKGAIFILVRDINAKESDEFSLFDKKDLQEPRLHSTDYTPKKHKQGQAAIDQIKKGKRVYGTSKKKGNGKDNGRDSDKSGKGNPWGMVENDSDLFYTLPPMVPPPK